jgi:cell division protein FtsI (penicillin-binding protein 3)
VLAGPVFKKVMSFVLQNERIKPSPGDESQLSRTEAALNSTSNRNKKVLQKSGA